MKYNSEMRIQVVEAAQALEAQVIYAAYMNHNVLEQRKGQSLMNALRTVAPELYEIISGTPADCFYNDDKLQDCFTVLGFTRRSFW